MSQSGRPAIAPQISPVKPEIQYTRDWFTYEIDTLALAAGASFNGNIQIQADSDFTLVKLVGTADIAGAPLTDSTSIIPLVTLNITDSGSGRILSNNPVPWGSIVGSAKLPFVLPVPRIFKARSNIAIALANYSAATTYNLRLAFEGYKIYQIG